ncbi:MAG TPA: hypothetical protein VFU49_07710 [Ktedonobacteraceae bacterium]|nr:hypothetical protein [Ktedonobacteraceae bacterium]
MPLNFSRPQQKLSHVSRGIDTLSGYACDIVDVDKNARMEAINTTPL